MATEDQSEHITQTTVEQEWMDFNHMAEQAMRRAMQQLEARGAVPVPQQVHTRAKDTTMIDIQPIEGTRTGMRWMSMRERKLPRLQGRIEELMRTDNLEMAETLAWKISTTEIQGVTVEGKTYQQLWKETEQLANQAAEDRRKANREDWLRECKDNLNEAFAAVRPKGAPPTYDVRYTQELASTPAEAIALTEKFWAKIWDRTTHPDQVLGALKHNMQEATQMEDREVTPEDLQRTARRMVASASGPDGWSGRELSAWSHEMWELYSLLLKGWQRAERYPAIWKEMRQVHLPKKDPQDDGTVNAADMRPIVVECTLWRVVASAMTRTEEMGDWINAWIHEDQYGAVAGRSLMAAIQKVDMAREQGHALLSLDLGKCFDRIDPQTTVGMLEALGANRRLTTMLRHAWQDKRRWMTIGKSATTQPRKVRSSMPQGDACSPLALNAIMSRGLTVFETRAREKDIPKQEYQQYTYLDDRSYTTKSTKHVKQIRQIWIDLVADLEGEENVDKAALLAKTFDQGRAIEEDEELKPIAVRSLRLLGVDLLRNHSEGCSRHTWRKRFTQAKEVIQKASEAPIGHGLRRTLLAATAAIRATWGTWLQVITNTQCEEFRKAVQKTLWGFDRESSVELTAMFTGHWLDLRYGQIQTKWDMIAWLAARRHLQRDSWENRRCSSGLIPTLRRCMLNEGWRVTAPWKWRHELSNSNMDARSIFREEEEEHH